MAEERRSDVRLMCADMVEVRWKTAMNQTRRATALLEDISRSGACLQLESPLPLGAELEVSCSRCRLAGRVRYCVYREIGYFVGVEFDSDCRWSPSNFRPQHLLNLRHLVAGARRPKLLPRR